MALLHAPCMVLTRRGYEERASALHVDLDTSRVYVSFVLEAGCCTGWFPVERVRLLDHP